MELQKYFTVLWRRKWVIMITMTVTMIVVIVGTLMIKPTYSASVILRIATSTNITAGTASDYMYADRLINTYVTISTSKIVLDELKQQLGLSFLPLIVVKTIPNTELIQIIVDDRDPSLAANVANTLGELLLNQSSELYSGGGQSSVDILRDQLTGMENEVNQGRKDYMDLMAKTPGDTEKIQAAKQLMDLKQSIYATMLQQYEQARLRETVRERSISVVQPAFPPDKPSKPNKVMNIALGFLIGAMGGLGLALLFENLDTRLYTTEQIDHVTKLPALGRIPNIGIHRGLVATNGNNPYGESFRRLRTHLHSLDRDTPLCTLLITSPEPGEGKSTISTNLAFTLAQSGQKVIIVDCDMRLPTQHKLLNLPNNQGLSMVLKQKSNLEEAIQATSVTGVRVLTSGPCPRNPSELLGSPEMSEIVEQLRRHFDMVIFDTPAILQVTDAAVLAPTVDGVLLVINRARSRKEDVREACKQLSDVKAKTIGVVINRAEQNIDDYYYLREQKKRPLKRKS
jgi:polysaccharide biosynthesis transport protein